MFLSELRWYIENFPSMLRERGPVVCQKPLELRVAGSVSVEGLDCSIHELNRCR